MTWAQDRRLDWLDDQFAQGLAHINIILPAIDLVCRKMGAAK